MDYIGTHFSDEEKLITVVGYPQADAHKQKHREFTAKIRDTLKSFNEAKFQDAMDFVHFLYDWILEHIAIMDKAYVPAVVKYLEEKKSN